MEIIIYRPKSEFEMAVFEIFYCSFISAAELIRGNDQCYSIDVFIVYAGLHYEPATPYIS